MRGGAPRLRGSESGSGRRECRTDALGLSVRAGLNLLEKESARLKRIAASLTLDMLKAIPCGKS
jgi:hypothetical protein